MNPNHKPFACAVAAGTTPFMWLVAGEQAECAVNDKIFNQVEVTQIKKEQDK